MQRRHVAFGGAGTARRKLRTVCRSRTNHFRSSCTRKAAGRPRPGPQAEHVRTLQLRIDLRRGTQPLRQTIGSFCFLDDHTEYNPRGSRTIRLYPACESLRHTRYSMDLDTRASTNQQPSFWSSCSRSSLWLLSASDGGETLAHWRSLRPAGSSRTVSSKVDQWIPKLEPLRLLASEGFHCSSYSWLRFRLWKSKRTLWPYRCGPNSAILWMGFGSDLSDAPWHR